MWDQQLRRQFCSSKVQFGVGAELILHNKKFLEAATTAFGTLKGHCKTGHAGSLQNRPWEGSRDLDVVLFRSLFGQV